MQGCIIYEPSQLLEKAQPQSLHSMASCKNGQAHQKVQSGLGQMTLAENRPCLKKLDVMGSDPGQAHHLNVGDEKPHCCEK